ncbi:uncharacterized protein [Chelonus insularis]|uniref:uncharacterized protein n=1 Tax=Chelonus insularis TaxID=460826 RepID=UPI00158ACDE0|nr:uncharacterized protein LOC118066164 [Chelonus insularis]
MKAPVVLLLVIGLTFYSTTQVNSNPVPATRALHDDLIDFLNLLPQDKIIEIFFEYLANDDEVKFVVEYVQTAEFHELVKAIEAVPEVVNFVNYLEESGLRVYDFVNKIHDAIGLPPIYHSHLLRGKSYNRQITGGVAGLIFDIKAILPMEDIKAMYYHKLENSVEFKELIDRLQSPKLQELINQLYTNDEFLAILETLRSFGVDLQAFADLLYTILGLEFPYNVAIARNHNEPSAYVDFNDFYAAISHEKISFVIQRYIEHDSEIKAIMAYMKTDNFKDVVKIVHKLQSVNDLYHYLDQSGLNIYPVVNAIHNKLIESRVLSNHALETKQSSAVPPTSGLLGLIDELLFSLPLMEWYNIYQDKMVNDKAFQNFVKRVSSHDFKMVVKTIFEDKTFKQAVDRIAMNGFDITPIIDFISTALHIDSRSVSFSTRSENLHEDFKDFIELLPKDEMIKIAIQYYLTDPDVKKAVAYLQSEEFRELALKFQHDKEFHELILYFRESGADVVVLINMVNELLGLPDFPDIHARALKSYLTITTFHTQQTLSSVDNKSGGMQAMLNEIRSIIPYDDIQAMYNLKMENSVHFQYFVERMKAAEHQELIDRLVQNENVLALAYQAHIHGINIEHIGQILFELFGLEFPKNPFGY